MEQELNIVAILKDKLKGTKLFDQLHNIEVELDNIRTSNDVTTIWCKRELPNKTQHFGYSERGTERGWLDGLQILKPSKEMQDWSKFAWKKGDVLKGIKGITCIFDSFKGEDYLDFCAWCYYDPEDEDWEYNVTNLSTLCFKKVDESDRANYIKKVEGHFGGKLNLQTLEIKKPEPQFKDGDIVVVDYVGGATFICICDKVEKDFMYCHTRMNSYNKDLYLKKAFLKVNLFDRNPRLATDSEKQQLFDALAKEGKRWNSETLTLENLPKKCEFKAFDWCLMRDFGEKWKLCQFGFMEEETAKYQAPYNAVGGNWFNECIHYNEQTKHLLGTTDEWKGGEK